MPLKKKPDLDLTEYAPSGGFKVLGGAGPTLSQMLQDPERYSEELVALRKGLVEAAALPGTLRFAVRAVSEVASDAMIARLAEYRALGQKAVETALAVITACRPMFDLAAAIQLPNIPALAIQPTVPYLPPPRKNLEHRVEELEGKVASQEAQIHRLRAELFLNAIVMWPPVDGDGNLLNPELN